jgi:predicted Zn-dependent protease
LVYATALENSSYYFLEKNEGEKAIRYLVKAQLLDPTDPDLNYLWARYYLLKNDCVNAEKSIEDTALRTQDTLYLETLKKAQDCYKDSANKKRIEDLIQKYTVKKTPLNKF